MNYVKNVAGLTIVLGVFAFGFLGSAAVFLFWAQQLFSGNVSLFLLVLGGMGAAGSVVCGWVLLLFAKNFHFNDLMTPDVLADRHDAPVAIEIRYDRGKSRNWLLDTRHSPRATNPKQLGRGVYIVSKKKNAFNLDKATIIIDSDGSKIKNVRDFDSKIYFDFIENGQSHTIEVAAAHEQSVNFEKKEVVLDLSNDKPTTKAQMAAAWAKTLV